MANSSSGSSRTQADKERSKQMSRPVTANQSARAGQTGRGGTGTSRRPGQATAGGPRRSDTRSTGRQQARGPAQGRGAARSARKRTARRSPTALLTWGTAALVLVIVVVLVVVKLTGGTNSPKAEAWSPLSGTVANELATVPPSVFNTVGVTSSVAQLFPPTVISGQKPLTFSTPSGTTLPGVFFYGAEYCPHCAAERWALVIALDRFGTFKGLGNMSSSSNDQPPSIATVTFLKAKYTSPYFVFKTEEAYSNAVTSSGSYQVLQKPTRFEFNLVNTYDSSKYLSGLQPGYSGFPFIDFGNKILSEESFSPTFLQGFTRDQIASSLTNSQSGITQAIVASSNMLSASICHIDGQLPATVCTSKGVTTAAKALKLS